MMINSVAATNVGRIRKNNEDNFYLCGQYRKDVDLPNLVCAFSEQRSSYLFSVCDGMGGEEYGELASLIAVRWMDKYSDDFKSKVHAYIQDANGEICKEILKHDGKRIGTTFAALNLVDGAAYAYNIGDSRIYLIRDQKISQLSEDHTQVQMLINQGFVRANDAKKHPARHVLTQHIGIFPEEMVIEPFCAEPIRLESGDKFLLCSDGLTDTLSDHHLLSVLETDSDLETKANAFIESAIHTGSRDNITVVLVEILNDIPLVNSSSICVDHDTTESLPLSQPLPERQGLISNIMKMIKERERKK